MNHFYIDYCQKAILEKNGEKQAQGFKFQCMGNTEESRRFFFSEKFFKDQTDAINTSLTNNGEVVIDITSCSEEECDTDDIEVKNTPIGYITIYPKVTLKDNTVIYGKMHNDFNKFMDSEDFIERMINLFMGIFNKMYEDKQIAAPPVEVVLCSREEYEENKNEDQLINISWNEE